ncbi:unnamed protein product [Urochloa humidicola]
MADRPPPGPPRRGRAPPPMDTEHYQQQQQQDSLIGRAARAFHLHAHGSTQLLGFLALAVTLMALVVLAGVTLAGAVAVAAAVLLSPLALLTLPLWAPVAAAAFLAAAASLLACCAGVAAVAAGTWVHRYLTGRHPAVGGARRAEPPPSRAVGGAAVAEVASHVRGYYDAYARQHGGFPPRPPHARVKDAAPGA